MQGSTRQARAGHYRFRLTRPRGSDGLRPLPVPQRGSRTALIDDGGVAWMVATALVAGEGRAHPGPPPPPPHPAVGSRTNLGTTAVTGRPSPSTRVMRSRRSHCDTRLGNVETMISS